MQWLDIYTEYMNVLNVSRPPTQPIYCMWWKKTAQPRSCPTATIQNPQAANDKDLAQKALPKAAASLSMVWGKAWHGFVHFGVPCLTSMYRHPKNMQTLNFESQICLFNWSGPLIVHRPLASIESKDHNHQDLDNPTRKLHINVINMCTVKQPLLSNKECTTDCWHCTPFPRFECEGAVCSRRGCYFCPGNHRSATRSNRFCLPRVCFCQP